MDKYQKRLRYKRLIEGKELKCSAPQHPQKAYKKKTCLNFIGRNLLYPWPLTGCFPKSGRMELYKGRVWLNGQQVQLRTLIRGISQENVFFPQNHHRKFPVCIEFFSGGLSKTPLPPFQQTSPHCCTSRWLFLSDVDRLEAFEGIGKALFGDVKWAEKNVTGTLMIRKSQLTSSGQSFIISYQLAPGRLKALSGYVTSIDLDMSMVVYPTIFPTSYNFWHLRWFSRISLREARKYYGLSVASWFILNVANLQ